MPPPLHVVRAGTGPLLVLVHGSATDHATWTIQLATRLPSAYRVVAYDRRGAGTSAFPHGVAWCSIEDHASDLAALIDAEGGGPALVAGSSCGAVVVLERRRPPSGS
jgi:pimeloyl-ACP methyl ester carboxylesterase